MNIGLHFKSRVQGASDTERALLEEFESLIGALPRWSNREHNDEGQHVDVTAQSVTITQVRDTALKVLGGLTDLGDAVAFSGVLTPDTIVSQADNYSPVGIEHAFLVRVSTDAARAMTGIQDGPRLVPLAGRALLLFNVGSQILILAHEDVSSDENFRFRLPGSGDVTIPPNGAALLFYDPTVRRWLMIGASGGTGSSTTEFNAGDSGPAITIDWANGIQQIVNLTDNALITFTNDVYGTEYRLLLTEGGSGNFVPTFDASVIFEDDTLEPAAVAAGETLILHLIRTTLDGGTYRAWYTPYEVLPDSSASTTTRVYEFVLGDGVSLIPSGISRTMILSASGLITSATLLSTDPVPTPCDLVLDVWKKNYSAYPPSVADTITASAKPTLASGIKYQDTTLNGWNKSYAPNDVWIVSVDTNVGATRASLFLTTEEA